MVRGAFPQVLAEFLETFPVGVFTIDGEGIIVYVNRQQCDNSCLSRDALVGKHYCT